MSSKLIKEKYLGHISSIAVWFCCFQVFQLPLFKVNKLDSYHFFDPPPLDQARLTDFRQISSVLPKESSKLIKEKYLDYNLSILVYACYVPFFPGKSSLYALEVNNLGSYHILDLLVKKTSQTRPILHVFDQS